MGGFSSFSAALAGTVGRNLLEKQKEEREHAHELKKLRIQQTADIMGQPGFDPQMFPGMLEGMLTDLEIDPKVIKGIHEHLGTNDPETVRRLAEQMGGTTAPGLGVPIAPSPGTGSVTGPDGEIPVRTGGASGPGVPSAPELAPMPKAPASYNPLDWQRKQNAILAQQIAEAKAKGEVTLGLEKQKGELENTLRAAREKQSAQTVEDFKKRRVDIYMANAGLTDRAQVPKSILNAIAMEAAGLNNPTATLPGQATVLGSELIAGNPEAKDEMGQEIDPDKVYTRIRSRIPGMVDVITPRADNWKWGGWKSDAEGTYREKLDPRTNRVVGKDYSIAPSSVVGTEQTTSQTREVQGQVNGQTVMIPTTTQTQVVRRPIGSGTRSTTPATPLPTPPAGVQAPPSAPTQGVQKSVGTKPAGVGSSPTSSRFRVIGKKGLTAEQQMVLEKEKGTTELAIPVFSRMMSNVGMLSNLLSAGKIHFSSDGNGLHALASRGVELSSAEAQYAADITHATEQINLLRKALGSEGFRGHEGWMGMQGMKGDVLAKPEVTQRIIRQTLEDFLKLHSVEARTIAQQTGQPMELTPDLAAAYLQVEGTKDKARAAAKKAGYVF